MSREAATAAPAAGSAAGGILGVAQSSRPHCGCGNERVCDVCTNRLHRLAALCDPPVPSETIAVHFKSVPDALHSVAKAIGYGLPNAERGYPGPFGPSHDAFAREILAVLSSAEHLDAINTIGMFTDQGLLGYGPGEDEAKASFMRSAEIALRRLEGGDQALTEDALAERAVTAGELAIGRLAELGLERLEEAHSGMGESREAEAELRRCVELIERYYLSASKFATAMKDLLGHMRMDEHHAADEYATIWRQHCTTIAKLLGTLVDVYHKELGWLSPDERMRKANDFWLRAAELGHPISCQNLGVSFSRGYGLPRSASKSIFWHERSRELIQNPAIPELPTEGYDSSLLSFLEEAMAGDCGLTLDEAQEVTQGRFLLDPKKQFRACDWLFAHGKHRGAEAFARSFACYSTDPREEKSICVGLYLMGRTARIKERPPSEPPAAEIRSWFDALAERYTRLASNLSEIG
ncbi:hypothetical protein DFJ74DRAFT_720108 [Hyaloraphidium curvatum]|nr:hypothetical protein DFJ74DRAFT_720108 [Hyaloraphidium curvatum]